MKEDGLRLFVALNVDRTARRAIVRLQENLWGVGCGGLTRPENLHLTLAFLGQTNPDRLEDLRKAMDQTGAEPLELIFDRLGVFRRESGDIWWLGMEENRALQAVQSRLAHALRQARFPVEDRKFIAHLTLARRVRPRHDPGRLEKPIRTRAAAISLMRSQRLDGKLVYTELYRVP